jgi:hypothetical protein
LEAIQIEVCCVLSILGKVVISTGNKGLHEKLGDLDGHADEDQDKVDGDPPPVIVLVHEEADDDLDQL